MEETFSWDIWVEEALSKLESLKLIRSLRPIHLPNVVTDRCSFNSGSIASSSLNLDRDFQFFDGPQKWDRASVEVNISEATFRKWFHDVPSAGDDNEVESGRDEKLKKLIVFSGNDYLGLSSHPTVINAASKAAWELGMGPRGSALICGYTSYHRLLESSLADLKRKEDSLGGNSKTTIIANISPSTCSAYETLSTLKFAQRAKLIQNNAKINEDASGDVIALQRQIQQLMGQLSFLMKHHHTSLKPLDFVPDSKKYSPGYCPGRYERFDETNVYVEHKIPRGGTRKMKYLEDTLSSVLHREKLTEMEVKRLKAEIEQMNLLVCQV